MTHSRKSKGKEHWTFIMEEWQESGLSGNRFCIQKGINQSVFHKWKKKLNTISPKTDQFVVIPVQLNHTETGLTLQYQDFQLKITDGFSKPLLIEVLKTLRQAR